MYNSCKMSTITTNYTDTLVSPGYYGQKPLRQDYPEKLRKPKLTPQQPETYTEMCKRYVWTVLPLMTLARPVGSAVTVVSELAKIAKSIDVIMKLRSHSYNAFQTALSAGMIATTVIEPFSPLMRRLFMGIQLLSLANQTALTVYRYGGSNDDYKQCKLLTHVVSNISAMVSLLSQNPAATLCFFLVQSLTAFMYAIRKFSKANYLGASVHAIMGSFRLFQAWKILDTFPIPLLAKAQVFLRKSQTIDPREPIKEQLTEQEIKLKAYCGEEYLYFKQNGPEEKFLILSAEYDHNGALDPIHIRHVVHQLSQRFDVKFRTVADPQDIPREITSAEQFGPITGLMLNAHGNWAAICLSNDSWLTSYTLTPALFSGLHLRCVIALRSCCTASDPSSVAYRVANCAQRVTFAPDDVCPIMKLEQLDPLEFSFECPGKSVNTKKIEPPENDSYITYMNFSF